MEKEKEQVEEVVKEGYPHESLQQIEDDRKAFLKTYRLHNRLKAIVAFACIAIIIVACIVLPNVITTDNKNLKTVLTIGLTVFALAGMIGYSIFSRKMIDKKMREYFKNFYQNSNNFEFDQKGFDKVELQEPGKITLEQFNDCKLYKDVVQVGSRGLTEFEFNGIPMAVVDCAGNTRQDKRIRPVFVGKYLFAACSYTEDEPIVVYLKGNERSLPPTNLEGLKIVVDEAKYAIYTNNTKWDKVLTKAISDKILAIKTNELLVDLAICIYGGRTFIMMGYDDPIMVLPLQQEFDSKPQEQYKKELVQICELAEALSK